MFVGDALLYNAIAYAVFIRGGVDAEYRRPQFRK
jgi:hypothetical protein